MADKEVNILKVSEELADITECSICQEIFTDPRMLPCIHTFCLECLQNITSGMKKMPCPMCRTEFTIPREGAFSIPKNFLMERLINMAHAINPKSVEHPCDACLQDKSQPGGGVLPAKMYCKECRQKLCDACCRLHQNKLFKTHRLIPFESDEETPELLNSVAPSICDKHDKNPLDLYCKRCNVILCSRCFLEGHKTHEMLGADEVLHDYRRQVENTLDKISGCITNILDKCRIMEIEKTELLRWIDETETMIAQTSEELITRLKEDTESLLREMTDIKQNRMKDIETEKDKVDLHLMLFENFTRYCNDIKTKGTAVEICKALNDINGRARELKTLHGTFTMQQLSPFKVGFEQVKQNSVKENMVGKFYGLLSSDWDSTDNVLESLELVNDRQQEAASVVTFKKITRWKTLEDIVLIQDLDELPSIEQEVASSTAETNQHSGRNTLSYIVYKICRFMLITKLSNSDNYTCRPTVQTIYHMFESSLLNWSQIPPIRPMLSRERF